MLPLKKLIYLGRMVDCEDAAARVCLTSRLHKHPLSNVSRALTASEQANTVSHMSHM